METKKPSVALSLSAKKDVARHNRTVIMVDQMLSLHKPLQEARTPHEQSALQRRIEATDRRIDALVRELYGLTEEEMGIVVGDLGQEGYRTASRSCGGSPKHQPAVPTTRPGRGQGKELAVALGNDLRNVAGEFGRGKVEAI